MTPTPPITPPPALSPETQRLNKAITEIMQVMFSNNITGGEYLFIVQTLAASALAQNPKSLENDFFASLKTDTLTRRLSTLRNKGKANAT